MERRIIRKVNEYEQQFKNSIKLWFDENNASVSINGTNNTSNFLRYVFDLQSIEFTKEDFQKRKRVKNIIPTLDRCQAKRANEQQCTRRKKNDTCFCGTHTKGLPHGKVDDVEIINTITKKEVWIQEIKGISYYIDVENNVYETEDIVSNKVNPRILTKCEKVNNKYIIPDYE